MYKILDIDNKTHLHFFSALLKNLRSFEIKKN